jgi:putative flippase GtrA
MVRTILIIRNYIKKLFRHKEVRFVFVGGINTIVGYGTFAIFIAFSFPYLVANTLSTVIGVINSYLWNRFFTFKSKNRAIDEIARFSLVYFISYCFGMLFLWVIVGRMGVNIYIAGAMNIFVTTLISWFGHKNFSFKINKVN